MAALQSQYATVVELQTLAITPAAAARYGNACEDVLKAASSVIDSYIVSQFKLPLTSWDMSLTLAACNIAAYLLACQFGFNPAAPGDQLVKLRYDQAISWLVEIREKKIFPQWEDSGLAPTENEAGLYVLTDRPVGFTPSSADATGDFWVPPCD